MKFAERMKLLAPSATFAVNTKALELKAKGIQVISLAVGEPDAPTPAHICASPLARAAMPTAPISRACSRLSTPVLSKRDSTEGVVTVLAIISR